MEEPTQNKEQEVIALTQHIQQIEQEKVHQEALKQWPLAMMEKAIKQHPHLLFKANKHGSKTPTTPAVQVFKTLCVSAKEKLRELYDWCKQQKETKPLFKGDPKVGYVLSKRAMAPATANSWFWGIPQAPEQAGPSSRVVCADLTPQQIAIKVTKAPKHTPREEPVPNPRFTPKPR